MRFGRSDHGEPGNGTETHRARDVGTATAIETMWIVTIIACFFQDAFGKTRTACPCHAITIRI